LSMQRGRNHEKQTVILSGTVPLRALCGNVIRARGFSFPACPRFGYC
jgi:hypothetical protein